jgi:hypothetical protein
VRIVPSSAAGAGEALGTTLGTEATEALGAALGSGASHSVEAAVGAADGLGVCVFVGMVDGAALGIALDFPNAIKSRVALAESGGARAKESRATATAEVANSTTPATTA